MVALRIAPNDEPRINKIKIIVNILKVQQLLLVVKNLPSNDLNLIFRQKFYFLLFKILSNENIIEGKKLKK